MISYDQLAVYRLPTSVPLTDSSRTVQRRSRFCQHSFQNADATYLCFAGAMLGPAASVITACLWTKRRQRYGRLAGGWSSRDRLSGLQFAVGLLRLASKHDALSDCQKLVLFWLLGCPTYVEGLTYMYMYVFWRALSFLLALISETAEGGAPSPSNVLSDIVS